MKDRRLPHDDGLARAVLEVIGHHELVPTMDIWYELGEDERFKDGIALAEVKEILFHLENSKRVVKEDGDKWTVKKRGCLRPDRRDFLNLRNFRQLFHIADSEGAPSKDQLESANRMEMARWDRFFEQLAEFSDYERKTERVCPICRSPFPGVTGLRAAVDRLSSCDHCFRRLISFLNGPRPISIERHRTS